jgi:xanthine dehydrogenase accessory factor
VNKELELWKFVAARLTRGEGVVLLVVAQSSGSSPGRHGYKMAVAESGELIGSIGGGVMEVNLVEESRRLLSLPPAVAGGSWEQVHRPDVANASGMICSGKQTVIFRLLTRNDASTVDDIVTALERRAPTSLRITSGMFELTNAKTPPVTAGGSDSRRRFSTSDSVFQNPKSEIPDPKSEGPPGTAGGTDFRVTDDSFLYTETLAFKNNLYILGGGHCALALSELMSKMDFHISIIDDRPELNTIEKNRYAHEIKIVDSYERISDYVSSGQRAYVVVMTLGYKTDGQVVRSLIDVEFKYFGVLGSKAKMATMLAALRKEGIPKEKLDRIRTPIGLPINSRTPEEIAVSIAAEIILVKNG